MIQGRSHPLDKSTKGGKALPSKLVNIRIPNYFSKYKWAILEQDATAFALYSILKLHSISVWDLQILLLLWAHLAEKHYLPQLNRWPKAFLRCILVNITLICVAGVESGRGLGGRDKRRGGGWRFSPSRFSPSSPPPPRFVPVTQANIPLAS